MSERAKKIIQSHRDYLARASELELRLYLANLESLGEESWAWKMYKPLFDEECNKRSRKANEQKNNGEWI